MKQVDPDREERATPPGWYPDPKMANTQRYWDGERWTDNAAPMPPPVVVHNAIDVWKGIRIVAVGILAAVAVIAVVYKVSQPSDLDCAIQRAEHATGERAAYEVDDACK